MAKSQKPLEEMTIAELVAVHNGVAPSERHVKNFRDHASALTAVRNAIKAQTRAQANKSRGSRIPIDAVKAAFSGVERSVTDAVKFIHDTAKQDLTERDVRLGIDMLRRKGVEVKRTKLKTFKIA